jgi:hypothetical protein
MGGPGRQRQNWSDRRSCKMAMWYANPIENVNRLGPKVVKILSLGLWRSLCQESGGSAEQLVTYPSEWT